MGTAAYLAMGGTPPKIDAAASVWRGRALPHQLHGNSGMHAKSCLSSDGHPLASALQTLMLAVCFGMLRAHIGQR